MVVFSCYGWLLMSNELARPLYHARKRSTSHPWFLTKLMMSSKRDSVSLYNSKYVLNFLHPIFPSFSFWFSRLPETDLSGLMAEKEASDECNATDEKEEGVCTFHYFEIWCFSVILLIYFQNLRGSAVAVISGFCSENLFLCCLMLINVNTACDLIPELLLTVASADIQLAPL